jgi:hypothetical protein
LINCGKEINNMAVKGELREILIKDLEFDPENPRLPRSLYNSSDREVVTWMLQDASLIDLLASIAYNGYFNGEPVLVVPHPEKKGKYIVVEGNRRLASVKILRQPHIASVKKATIEGILEEAPPENIPEKLPAFEFRKKEDVLAYLGYRHVTGIKNWGALSKAKYIDSLYHTLEKKLPEKEKYQLLAKKIGSKGYYVQRLHVSYRLFIVIENNGYYGIKNLDDESIDFSNLVDAATRYAGISEFLDLNFQEKNPLKNLNTEHLAEVTRWLFEKNDQNRTRVGENRNIRILNAIVKAPRALEAFREGKSLDEASLLTSMPDEIVSNAIQSALTQLKYAQENIHLLKIGNPQNIELLHEANQVIKILHNVLTFKQSPIEDL